MSAPGADRAVRPCGCPPARTEKTGVDKRGKSDTIECDIVKKR